MIACCCIKLYVILFLLIVLTIPILIHYIYVTENEVTVRESGTTIDHLRFVYRCGSLARLKYPNSILTYKTRTLERGGRSES